MKVAEFMEMLGSIVAPISYDIHWINNDETDVNFHTKYEEAVIEIFGNHCIAGRESIYITTNEQSSRI